MAQESTGGQAQDVAHSDEGSGTCRSFEAVEALRRKNELDERDARRRALSAMGVTEALVRSRLYVNLLKEVEGHLAPDTLAALRGAQVGQEVEIDGSRYGIYEHYVAANSLSGMYRELPDSLDLTLGRKEGRLHPLRDSYELATQVNQLVCGRNPCDGSPNRVITRYAKVAVKLDEGESVGETLDIVYPRRQLTISYVEQVHCMPGPVPSSRSK